MGSDALDQSQATSFPCVQLRGKPSREGYDNGGGRAADARGRGRALTALQQGASKAAHSARHVRLNLPLLTHLGTCFMYRGQPLTRTMTKWDVAEGMRLTATALTDSIPLTDQKGFLNKS